MTSKERLEQYIKEDKVYNDWLDENTSYVSDFDRFCIQHCEDIKCLLEENEKLKQWDNNKDSRNSRQRVANAKLLKENQKLRKKLDKYENPEDLTLMFMYCDEKARDKIKELEKQLEEYKEQVHKGLYSTCLPYTTGYNKAIKDKEIQQKAFIKYLEDEIESCELICDLIFNRNKKMKVYKQILQKFKEIVNGTKRN